MKGLRLLRWGILLALLNSCGTIRPAGGTSTPAFDMTDVITDKCWIYTHLNKSGGSTVKGILHGHWSQRYHTYSNGEWWKGEIHMKSVADKLVHFHKWNVVAGGYAESLRRSSAVDRKCQWFTVFRHPISRIVSAYYYCKAHPTDQTCASNIVDANQVDLATFAKHWGNYATRQFILSFISIDDALEFSRTDAAKAMLPNGKNKSTTIPGWYTVKLYLNSQTQQSNVEPVPDAGLYTMLQPVQDLLRDHYSAVGILEEYNTTLSLFNAALDMPKIDWHERFASTGEINVNNEYKEKAATLAEAWTNSKIKAYMQLDLSLYDYAVELFHKQAQTHGI